MTTNEALFSAKQALRQQMRGRLKAMTVEQIARASEQLVRLLMNGEALELAEPVPSPLTLSSEEREIVGKPLITDEHATVLSPYAASMTQLRSVVVADQKTVPLSPGERVGVRGQASLSRKARLPSRPTVALFGGIAGEPDLLPLIPWLIERGCTPVLFGFADGQLVPKAVRSADDLDRGVFGVWVPRDDLPLVDVAALDVILTPGLAFDKAGHRLGRGRGYYDRLFADPLVKAKRIALGFDFQLVDTVPVEAHDALMHQIITETGAKMQN